MRWRSVQHADRDLFPVPIIFSAFFGLGNILCFSGIL